MQPLQKPGHHRNQCRQLKREKEQTRNNTNSTDNTKKMVVLIQTPTPTINHQTKLKPKLQIFKETEDLDLSSHPLRPVVELITPQRIVTLEQTQRTDRCPPPPPPEQTIGRTKQPQQKNAQSNSNGNVQAATQILN